MLNHRSRPPQMQAVVSLTTESAEHIGFLFYEIKGWVVLPGGRRSPALPYSVRKLFGNNF